MANLAILFLAVERIYCSYSQRMKKLHIVTSVTNDLSNDQRVRKICSTFMQQGHTVFAVGRRLKSSNDRLKLLFQHHLLNVWWNKGPLFYLSYNIVLFLFLLRQKADVLIANDLDTLLANFFVSKLRNIPLIYDSHEYFTEVPELKNKSFKRKIWLSIESYCLKRIQYAMTVSLPIQDVYKQKYGLKCELVRNFPNYKEDKSQTNVQNFPKIVLYQGALNRDRGLKELVKAVKFLTEDVHVWIAGRGDEYEELLKLSQELALGYRLSFLGHIEMDRLSEVTAKASLGLSIEKLDSLNYRYALPNKVFDYIHAGVPVLYSPFTELDALLNNEYIGQALKSHDPKKLANQIQSMLTHNDHATWVVNCKKLAKEFTWEKEEDKLIKLLNLATQRKA